MPLDPRTEWVGPIPTDPLVRCLEYKLGFDDVEDLQAKGCVITHDPRKQFEVEDAIVFSQALVDQGPCMIQYLFLQGNLFGDEGLASIAKAMAEDALPKLLILLREHRRFLPALTLGRSTQHEAAELLGTHGLVLLHRNHPWRRLDPLQLGRVRSVRQRALQCGPGSHVWLRPVEVRVLVVG